VLRAVHVGSRTGAETDIGGLAHCRFFPAVRLLRTLVVDSKLICCDLGDPIVLDLFIDIGISLLLRTAMV
jgi:hypothetical protein